MWRSEGALAIRLEFGGAPAVVTSTAGRGWSGLRLVPRPAIGPEKYRLLEQRRRAAQRKARRLLQAMEAGDPRQGGE